MTYRGQLRVYFGPDEEITATHDGARAAHTVTLPIADVLPVLAHAIEEDRGWLRDFADDEITISTDLYEVLLAYQHYRRPSA